MLVLLKPPPAVNVLILMLLSAFAFNIQAQVVNNAKQPNSKTERFQLSGEQIVRLFSNVRDEAIVRDEAGTTATNFWFADGRIISRWRTVESSGEVTGNWSVKD